MSQFKWEFDLKQQTPMLHFQSDEIGACLRTTEVKPKFDRFLLQHIKMTEEQEKRWLQKSPNGEKSTRLKMRFLAPKAEEISNKKDNVYQKNVYITSKINQLYFGNISSKGKNDKEDKGIKSIFYNDNIKGVIVCFESDLLEIVKKFIPKFFLFQNFGTRQNKGFGSFTVIGNERITNVIDTIKDYEPTAYVLNYNRKFNKKNLDERMEDIRLIYSLMKSGINNTSYCKKNQTENKIEKIRIGNKKSQYYKGGIMRYYQQKGINNDKKFIKTTFFSQDKAAPLKSFYFVRGVLGLPQFYTFRDDQRQGTITVSHDTIKRYASPIYFKVIDQWTFLYLKDMPEKLMELKHEPFFFKSKFKAKKSIDKLYMPDFDIHEFMQWFQEDFNNKEIIKTEDNKIIRGSLKAQHNEQFIRIEQLQLRRISDL